MLIENKAICKKIIFNRYDIIIKYMYFKALLTNTNIKCNEDIYIWSILKRTRGIEPGNTNKQSIKDYIHVCKELLSSFKINNFNPNYPIKLDSNYILHGGSHRLAVSILLDIDPVFYATTFRKNPRKWDEQWYRDRGITELNLMLIESYKRELLIKLSN